MRKCYQAELLKTEMEVQYFPYGGSITDYVMRLFDRKVAVSVTRALRFDGEPFTVDNGVRLLTKKLLGIRQADRNSLESWQRHVLHVWADGRAVTEALAEAHRQLPASVLGNAIVLLTCVRNCKEIFTNNLFQRIRKPPTRVPPSHWLSSSSSRLAERELRRHRQTAAPSVRRSFRSCRAAGKSLTSLLLLKRSGDSSSGTSGFHFGRALRDQPQTVVAGFGPVPSLLAASCRFLSSEAAQSAEGLFRVEGARPRLLLLRARLDADRSCDIPADTPPQDVCSTLKAWLRQLPRPLLPAATAEALSGAANSAREDCDGDAQQRLSALRAVAAANLGGDGGCSARALRLLCLLLHRLAAAGCHGNRMDSASLATCLGPCLYGAATADSAETAARLNRGVALLIRSAPDIPDAAADADEAEAQPPCQKLHRRPRPRSLSRIREAVVRAVTRLGGQSRSRSRSRSTSVSLLRLPREPARMQPAAASSKPELTRHLLLFHLPHLQHLLLYHLSHLQHLLLYHLPHLQHLLLFHLSHLQHLLLFHLPHLQHLLLFHLSHLQHLLLFHLPHLQHLLLFHLSHLQHLLLFHLPHLQHLLLFTCLIYSIFCCSTCLIYSIFCCSTCLIYSIFCCSTCLIYSIFCCSTCLIYSIFCCSTCFIYSIFCCTTCLIYSIFCCSTCLIYSIFCCTTCLIYSIFCCSTCLIYSIFCCSTCLIYSIFCCSTCLIYSIFCCSTCLIYSIFCCSTCLIYSIFCCSTCLIYSIFCCSTCLIYSIFCWSTCLIYSIFCCSTCLIYCIFCCSTCLIYSIFCWSTCLIYSVFCCSTCLIYSIFCCSTCLTYSIPYRAI
uniref:Rho-GAP domain-containing protein n=1 Tax=Macrostomum lignano TaxID=282301 RepID=A0A1I8I354_9PLAT